ncbi:MAG TPA: exodeoxyribonuclease V subunit alpha [Rhodanobacteraceae bacterium]|nr:exodeoxyribonuclease V subunit alpha [Rhodanobacteraceae bacterium]
MSLDLHALVRGGRLRRADVALGELVARLFPDGAPEVALAAALAARAIADGHSALQLDAAQAWFESLEGTGTAPWLPEFASWRAALHDSAAVAVPPVDDATATTRNVPLVLDPQGRLYLRRYFEYERCLARTLIARAHQRRLELITGGPGTGKTHGVLQRLVELAWAAHAQSRSLRIALAAPTGKAAARLAESVRTQREALDLPGPVAAMIPHQAQTLHRLLGLSPVAARAGFHRAAPLPFDVVVVDEVSMVDLPLMTKLAAAVREDAVLILLGDPDQLSAVEAGDVLGALVQAAGEASLEACHVRLSHSRRFDEHSSLARLAQAVVRGDADAALATFAQEGGARLLDDDARHAHWIERAASAYHDVVDAADARAALQAASRFRVLTALRRGPFGCVALNRAIEQDLKRRVGVRADSAWWRGRLVMVTANRADIGLFNGDIGVAWPDAQGEIKVCFEAADGVLRALAPAALPPHEGAFALTVHKAQGSEFERVALVPGADSPVLTRELLYTGITRARALVEIHADAGLLRAGIACRTLRWNGLADRLREAAAGSIAESLPVSF